MFKKKEREEGCYGINCTKPQRPCMHISVGCVTALLLIGFLWGDIINTSLMIKASFESFKIVNKTTLIASIIILFELCVAIVCGILVGIYTESEFDAINGAVGILFVHDLDEKIYSAINVIENNWKRILVLFLWIILAIVVASSCACKYSNGFWLSGTEGLCKNDEYKCNDGECIWQGFICNGVNECADGDDEQYVVSLEMQCDYSLINCPDDEMFMCNSTGACIDGKKQCNGINDCQDGSDELWYSDLNSGNKFRCATSGLCLDLSKRCNGILDCPDGSDEHRSQNCTAKIADIVCNDNGFPAFEMKYSDNDWYEKVTDGMFKCNNGQCIDAKYMCDGVSDCLDGSDEYPYFDKLTDWPFLKKCPYSKLIECDNDKVLCKTSGKCISKLRLCDASEDCPDGQDETACPFIYETSWASCPPGLKGADYFYCGSPIAWINGTHFRLFEDNGQSLIPYIKKLDIWYDYLNRTTYDGQLMNGLCLPWKFRCDGIADCGDGTDEYMCQYFECTGDQYQCGSGECIPKEWMCDDWEDCNDGSDESVCNKTTHYNAKTISCNEYDTGTFDKIVSSVTYYITIPCSYNAVQFTTCANETVGLNTFMWAVTPDYTEWINFDASNTKWPCNINPVASTIVINSDELQCNVTYSVHIEPKYFKETFGDYGFAVICSAVDF